MYHPTYCQSGFKPGQNEVDAPLLSAASLLSVGWGGAAGGVRPPDEELVMISRCLRLTSNVALFSAHLRSPETIKKIYV